MGGKLELEGIRKSEFVAQRPGLWGGRAPKHIFYILNQICTNLRLKKVLVQLNPELQRHRKNL